MGCIYIATSPSGKSYIGKAVNFLKRKKYHRLAASKSGFLFHRAIRKYGWDAIEWDIRRLLEYPIRVFGAEHVKHSEAAKKRWARYHAERGLV